MSDFNKVILLGNLTRDPELKYTPNGQPVCNLGLAVNRTWLKDGQKQKDTTFLTIVVWGKQAENCGTYLAKGKPVLVEGRLQSRSWEKDGHKHSTVEVVADRVQFLGGRDSARGGNSAGPADRAPASEEGGAEDDIPF